MPAGIYDIYAEQGASLKFHLLYTYGNDIALDLTGIDGRMQVRRSENDEKLILDLSLSGLTGGGITGEYDPSTEIGISGTGGIFLNVNYVGRTGYTGGILVSIDKNTMANIPQGKHFYDIKLSTNETDAIRLVQGLFQVSRQITR